MSYRSVFELFDVAAEKFSDHWAIECGERRITFKELDRSARSLASRLLFSGTRKGAVVAVVAEDVTALVVAMLGTMRAGCVYVFLEANTPEKRLAAMIEEVSPQVIVAERGAFQRVKETVIRTAAGAEVIYIDEIDEPGYRTANQTPGLNTPVGPEAFSAEVGPDDMCYVFFTSGSTGKPKGIAGRRKGIDHYINWETKTLGIGAGIQVSQLIRPAFDAFLRDVFVPLCTGGTICVPPDKDALIGGRKLVEWINAKQINLIHCVPSLFRSIANAALDSTLFSSLKYVLLSGEPLLPADVKRWTDVFGDRIQLVNLYGPTETTMTKFFYFVNRDDKDRRSIPIGKPMEGARAAVVDAQGRMCSTGEVGEIYIRTPFCTLGYFKQPLMTSEVFVPNPISRDPNDLVYKTGDLGRVLEDGNFEFLGRKDLQVKIRGARVELAEIENLLRHHEAVEHAVVTDREDSLGNKYLCAFVVLNNGNEASVLKTFLSKSLPDYMVPSVFVKLEEMPVTPSGKIDRDALPAPGEIVPAREMRMVLPRTELETALADIWKKLLRLDSVGIYDNFFDSGGHSLLATQVISSIREFFNVELPLRVVFEQPTIAGLAVSLEQAVSVGRRDETPPLEPLTKQTEFPLSFAQQRMWFLHQLVPDSPFYNIPAAVRLTGPLNVAAMRRVLSEVVRRHKVLRTRFETVEGQPLQIIYEPQEIKFPMVDLCVLEEKQREVEAFRLMKEEAERPFDLSRGPLLRAALLKVADAEHVVLLTMHHIVSDGWSTGVLVREVAALYEAYAEGKPSPLPELPIQYADFAVWQREWLRGAVLEEQLSYWRKQLEGAPTVLPLPTDRVRPAVQTHRGARQRMSIAEPLLRGLKELSQQESSTLFMTLLAAFQVLLCRYSGQEDILVGSPVANRNRAETENLIGFFVNTLVLRAVMRGNPSFRELLRQVREVTLGAYAHQDLPFEKLVDELQPERDLSRQPLFQVMFALQNVPGEDLELVGLKLSRVETTDVSAKFDLMLVVGEENHELLGSLEYNSDLFDESSIIEMCRHFQNLLDSIVANPDGRLDELKVLSEEEHLLLEQPIIVEEFDTNFSF